LLIMFSGRLSFLMGIAPVGGADEGFEGAPRCSATPSPLLHRS
jgi:hypothetical protein